MSDSNQSFTQEVSPGDLVDLSFTESGNPVPAADTVFAAVFPIDDVPVENSVAEQSATPPASTDEEWDLGEAAPATPAAPAADFSKLAEALGVDPEQIKTVDDVLELLNSEGNINYQAQQILKADSAYSSLSKLQRESDDTILLAAFKGNPAQFFNIEGNTPEEKLDSVKSWDVTAYRNLVSGVKTLIENTLSAREEQAYKTAVDAQRGREEKAKADAVKRVSELKQYVDELAYFGKKIPAPLKEAILSPKVQEEFFSSLMNEKEMLVNAMLQFSMHPLAVTLRDKIGNVPTIPGKSAGNLYTSRPVHSPTAPALQPDLEEALRLLEKIS